MNLNDGHILHFTPCVSAKCIRERDNRALSYIFHSLNAFSSCYLTHSISVYSLWFWMAVSRWDDCRTRSLSRSLCMCHSLSSPNGSYERAIEYLVCSRALPSLSGYPSFTERIWKPQRIPTHIRKMFGTTKKEKKKRKDIQNDNRYNGGLSVNKIDGDKKWTIVANCMHSYIEVLCDDANDGCMPLLLLLLLFLLSCVHTQCELLFFFFLSSSACCFSRLYFSLRCLLLPCC